MRERKRVIVALGCTLGVGACSPLDGCATAVQKSVEKPVSEGRLLFLRGVSASGAPLRGFLGEDRIELTGRAAACANCHHYSGQGTKEGGVAAPDITARSLFRPRTGGPEVARPAYDDERLAAVLTRGITPTGRHLSIAMPRFNLSKEELRSMLAWLHVLGEAPVPGVTSDTIRVGAALPLSGPLTPVGEDVRDVLRAAFADINARGGLYRRRLELVAEDEHHHDAAERLLDTGVLTWMGSRLPDAAGVGSRLALEGVPVLVPFGFPEAPTEATEVPTFVLYPDLGLQARAAVQYLAGADGDGGGGPGGGSRQPPRLMLVHARDEPGAQWGRGALAEAERRELPKPEEHVFAAGGFAPDRVIELLGHGRLSAVLFHGTRHELLALLDALEAAGKEVPVVTSSLLAGSPTDAESTGWDRATFIAPTLLGSQLQSSGREFIAFLERHQLRPRHLAFQMSAYAAARLLEESLKRTGAAVSREGLVAAFESLREFDTRVTPPVTFAGGRHVGIRGAYVVRWSRERREFVPVSPWVEVAP